MNQAIFYQVGGDLKFQHPSYISRQSDQQLYQAIRAGDFCYVLNCRQMGKSSLAVQIFHRLKADGYACCFISLSDIGSGDVTPDSWYFTLTHKIARKLRIDLDISAWWKQQQLLSAVGKFSQFIEEILLVTIDQNIVIILDEIDCINRLEFGADDFLAAIRSCYNHRGKKSEYQRLQFTFLGVASPSSLIRDSDCTPFNIGKAIVLQGFKLDEAQLLAKGLVARTDRSQETITEILRWTGGQPFLTQKLCKLIAESTDLDFSQNPQVLVEQITRSSIIDNWTEQDNPQHLKTIQDRILNRKELTIKLLWLYKEILSGKKIRSDSSIEQVELRLSGLVIDRNDTLEVFNPIYQEIFNSTWLIQKLSELSIPYLDKITAWEESNRQDKSQLLTKEALYNALQWAKDRNLSSIDWQYLNASETAIIVNDRNLIARKSKQIGLLFTSFAVGATIFGSIFYHQYASCSISEGTVGERIGDVCFRSLTTSGEKSGVVSSSNFYLKQGVKKFKDAENLFKKAIDKDTDYDTAKSLFQKAIDGDRTDPIAQIFYNNTEARLRKNSFKIAAVVPIDYYEDAALDILRGVADAQTQFNQNQNKNNYLLEVVIVNDGNKPAVARHVSKELANNKEILAIVGHHFSSSTTAGLLEYKRAGIAVVSPTSSSSELSEHIFSSDVATSDQIFSKNVFFPTIISTKDFADIYATYFDKNQITNIAVIHFANPNDLDKADNKEYAKVLYKDFGKAIRGLNIKIVNPNQQNLDSIKLIKNGYPQTQAILAISTGETNSAIVALARENSQLPPNQRIRLFATHAVADRQTLDRLGKSIAGISLISPCQNNENSTYITAAKKRWEQDQIDWRTGYSYDATNRIIKAISQSQGNPDHLRREIIEKLRLIELTSDESSGFILFNGGKSIASGRNPTKISGCLWQLKQGKFVEQK